MITTKIALVISSIMLVNQFTDISKSNSQILVASSAVIGGASITNTKIGNWNTAFSWGNHSGLYALLSGSYSNPSWITSLAVSKVTGLSTVATTGSYSDLTGKPSLFDGTYASLSGKPTLFSGAYTDLTGKPTLFSGVYVDLTGKPSLATVATSGVYSDLTGKPSLFDGVYASLTGKPTLFDGAYSSLSGKPTNVSSFTNDAGYITSSYVPTLNAVTRPINSTTFTPSTTKQAIVSYSITISCTASIGSASNGQVELQYSTNGGSSWIPCGVVKNSNTVTLAIALNSVTIQTSGIMAVIPANALCKMVSTSSGTTSITYNYGFETY